MQSKFLIFLLLFLPFISNGQDSAAHPLMVQTIGRLPYLEYGLGDDRLGGAKMTYLDSGVVMRVVDSAEGKYKVQLSRNHSAYIPKENVSRLPFKIPRPYYLSAGWKIYGDDTTNADYVTILLDERLPYRSIQQINPSRIVIDIFGATSNSNWISQYQSVKEIKNTWYEQTEDDVMRVFIELKHNQHWGYNISYDTVLSKLIIKVKRQPSSLALNRLKIAIDAGHGGENIGATGVQSGIKEKEYTLKIATELNKLLRKYKVKTFMVRTSDTTLSMAERISMLKAWNPDLLISVHLNSSGNPHISGTSTYYRYIGFRSLSQSILSRMLELKLTEAGNVGGFNFSLNGPTDYPNCLVEVAFLSNPADEKRILNAKFRTAVAQKIFEGINDWLKKIK